MARDGKVVGNQLTLNEMRIANLAISGLVFVISVWFTGRLSSPSSKVRLLDHPNERSLHAEPVPRTGGLAILSSLAIGMLLTVFLAYVSGDVAIIQTKTNLWFVVALLVIAGLSLWNEWRELPQGVRLGIHGLAAAIVLAAGLRVSAFCIPLIGEWPLGLLAVLLNMLFLLWMTNLYNFMDGMDGFAGGMTVVGFGFLSYFGWTSGDAFIGLVSLLTVCAAAGFAVHNRPPARIFMGDAGSILLGFLAGAISVMGIHHGSFDFWVPVLIFSPFIVDATITLFRRLLRGQRIWQAHREHYYQRMVLLGWTHRQTVMVEYCLMIAGGVSAVVYGHAGETLRLIILLGWVFVYTSLAIAVRLAETRSNGRQRLSAEQSV